LVTTTYELERNTEEAIRGRVNVMGRRRRRRKQLLDTVRKRGYCKLNEAALDCSEEYSLWMCLWLVCTSGTYYQREFCRNCWKE